MNYRLIARLLGLVSLLIGGAMALSLPWAWPWLGQRGELSLSHGFEYAGFSALLKSMAVCAAAGAVLLLWGGKPQGRLYRKEALAVVGLSWFLATLLGALPYLFSGACRAEQTPMTIADALFESQSGFSTTGATVLTDLEDPAKVAHCILFWRSSTHFLGGLGIIVMFVVILGQGAVGKAIMRAEMPGPDTDGPTARMQHTAWLVAATYALLNLLLAAILMALGMTSFDALCHTFGTMATGGFSTYNASVGQFQSAAIDYVLLVFMVLAGCNFTLLFACLTGDPWRLFRDVEWRGYMAILILGSAIVVVVGLAEGDFQGASGGQRLANAVRYGSFQVVSIMTTTGFGTHDFDQWSNLLRGLLLVLMFVGGCAGSTGGGIKVIRVLLFFKILRLELERAYRPAVVRPLRLGGKPVKDDSLRHTILVYFCFLLLIFVSSWCFLLASESDLVWGDQSHNKLIDAAGAVSATLNNIGPGLGIVGATSNYAALSDVSKLLFVILMMIGRLEIFAVLVLFSPRFWKAR